MPITIIHFSAIVFTIPLQISLPISVPGTQSTKHNEIKMNDFGISVYVWCLAFDIRTLFDLIRDSIPLHSKKRIKFLFVLNINLNSQYPGMACSRYSMISTYFFLFSLSLSWSDCIHWPRTFGLAHFYVLFLRWIFNGCFGYYSHLVIFHVISLLPYYNSNENWT